MVSDLGSDSFTVSGSLVIPANGYVLMGNSAAGLVTLDYVYSGFSLANGADEVVLSNTVGVIDQVEYDGGPVFPDPNGASMNLNPSMLDATSNDDGANWCESSSSFSTSTSDLGTPGAANDTCATPQSFTYTADVSPILSSCTGCHGSSGGFTLNYNNLFTASSTGMNYITSGDTSQSYLWLKINGQGSGNNMATKPGVNLTQNDFDTIEEWINQGAAQ